MATTFKTVKLKDGSLKYRVRFRLSPGTNPVNETFDDIEEAQRFCDLVDAAGGLNARKARNAATKGGAGRSVQAAFETYLTHAGTNAQPDTLQKYRRQWNRHIGPRFGAWPLEALSRESIEQWIVDLRETQTLRSQQRDDEIPDFLAPKTISNIHGILSSVLKNEVANGRLPVNPAYAIELPKMQKKREATFLTPADYANLYPAVASEWQDLINLIAGTGLRWSEATALRTSDFDIEATQPVVRISRAWKRGKVGEGWHEGAPKTTQSTRTVSLSPTVWSQIQKRIDDTTPGALLFTGPLGGRLRGEWFHERVWRPAIDRAGIGKRPVLHDLRHSHASWLIAQGVPLTMIQRRLGHSSIKVTSDIYGHLAPDAWQITAEATEIAMSQALPAFEPPLELSA